MKLYPHNNEEKFFNYGKGGIALKTTFTPGPWKIEYENDGTPVITYQTRNICIVESAYQDLNANARLIAAAPEMYEILKKLATQEDWQGETITPESPVGKAWTIISKIDGE